jgi:hypothetical protein
MLVMTWKDQVKIAVAQAVGYFILILPCICKAWTAPTLKSIKPGHPPVDQWAWGWLNAWYGNAEDGVSGQQAILVGGALYPTGFRPWVPAAAIAWAWSAWRNGANNVKRPFRNDSWLPS